MWPLLSFLLALVAIAIRRRYVSSLSKFPGPFWASITRLWHAYHIFKGDHNTVLIALHQKYGHFVRISPDEVSISHPDGPKIILQGLLRKGDWYQVFSMPDWRFVTPQCTLDPKEKIERSKSFAAGFSLSQLLRQEHQFDANIERLLGWMDHHSETYQPMHLDKYFTYTAFDNMGEAVFSHSFGFISRAEDIDGSIGNSRSLNRYLAIAGYYIWFHRLFVANPLITWLGILPMGHLFTTSKLALQKRKRDPDARFDIIAHWLKVHRDHPDRVSLRDIEAQATISVAAGSDTLSCALQAFVYFMIKNAASWQRARDEIATMQTQGLCQTRVIKYTDTRNLVFTKACLYEALRMFGPGPFGFPRIAPPDGVKIGDTFFHPGTVLSVNPQVMQQSEECWDNTAKLWNPERWLIQDMNAKYKHWLVFGMGFNRCPGEHLAFLQMIKIAATIIRDYSIEQVKVDNIWKWKAYFTVVPHSWPVYITKVDQAGNERVTVSRES